MRNPATGVRSLLGSLALSVALALGSTLSVPTVSYADEDGIGFWLPGLFGSLTAVPQHPGWSVTAINYFDSVSANGNAAAAREITIGKLNPTVNVNLNVNVKATLDLVFVGTGYVFATPVFGGQLNLAMFGLVGPNSTALNGSLTLASGPFTITRQGSISQTTTGFGDLYPQAIIRWTTASIIGWCMERGIFPSATIIRPIWPISASVMGPLMAAAATHPRLGHEFSAVTGFTYNLINPSTNYQNGIDWHLDWGASTMGSLVETPDWAALDPDFAAGKRANCSRRME
jgi:hypothetical protein